MYSPGGKPPPNTFLHPPLTQRAALIIISGTLIRWKWILVGRESGGRGCGSIKIGLKELKKEERGERKGWKNEDGSKAFSLMRAKTVEVWDVIISVFIETNLGSVCILKSEGSICGGKIIMSSTWIITWFLFFGHVFCQKFFVWYFRNVNVNTNDEKVVGQFTYKKLKSYKFMEKYTFLVFNFQIYISGWLIKELLLNDFLVLQPKLAIPNFVHNDYSDIVNSF